MYGQCSVFTRIRDDSDLDLILVWDELPPTATLTGKLTSEFMPHEDVVLEKATLDAYDVDLMHVPRGGHRWLYSSLSRRRRRLMAISYGNR